MIKQLKQFTLNLVAGANVATVIVMLLVGFSDRVSPASFPLLAVAGMAFPFLVLANVGFLFFWLTFKWRRMWIPVAGFLCAYVPINTYLPLSSPQEVPEGALKIVSYNVCGYGGNYKYENGFDRVLGYLAEQDADIVCIQEDIDTWRKNVFQRYQAYYPYNDTTKLSAGNAANALGMHTRFPILRKECLPGSSPASGTVAYYLLVGADTVLVINNHLEGTHLSKKDRSQYQEMLKGKMESETAKAESKLLVGKLAANMAKRAPEAEAIHRYVESHRQYPLIVCGDFNDTPISYTHHVVSQGLTDCFRASGRGLGVSYNQKGFLVRIDHIFCSSHFQPYNCKVDGEIDFSDHNPVVCWLKMRDNPQKMNENQQ